MTDQTKQRMVIPTYAEAAGAMGACKASHLEHFLFSLDENLAEDENRDVWREFLADVLTEQIAHREAAAVAAALRMAAEHTTERNASGLITQPEDILALITPSASAALASMLEEAEKRGHERCMRCGDYVDACQCDGGYGP